MHDQFGALANGGNNFMMTDSGLHSPMRDSAMMMTNNGPVFDDQMMLNDQSNFGPSQFDNEMLQTPDSNFYPYDQGIFDCQSYDSN